VVQDTIEFDTVEKLVTVVSEYLPPNITVGIHCSCSSLFISYSSNTFLFTRIFLQDVERAEDRAIIKEETHNGAHRGLDENYKQISRLC